MSDQNIIRLCRGIVGEAETIIQLTENISMTEETTTKEIFTEVRHDELGHLQKFTIALSETMVGKEPVKAENMDSFGENKGDKEIEIKCRDANGNLQALLNYIATLGNIGHTFTIIVDPSNEMHRKKFEFDGDGSDTIYKIEIEDYYEGGDKDDD